MTLARPLADISQERDFPIQVQNITQNQVTVFQNQTKQVRQFREERVKVEREGARNLPQSTTDPKRRARSEPSKLKLPEVPTLGSPAAKGKKNDVRPRPDEPRFPEINPKQTAPAPKGKGRNLPDPDDIIRQPLPKTPKNVDPTPPMKKSNPLPKPKKVDDDPDPLPKKINPMPKPKKVDDDPDPIPKKINPMPRPKKVDDDPDPLPKKVNPVPPPKKVDPAPLPKQKNDPPPKKGPPPKKNKDKDGD